MAVGYLRNDAFNVATIEAAELYDADIWKPDPGRFEFRPKGEKGKGRYLAHSIDHEIQQLEGGGIGPMCILEQEQDRFLMRQPFELIEQCRQRAAKLLRGTERQGRIPAAQWDRQQRRQQRDCIAGLRPGLAEKRLQSVEALLGRIVRLEPRRPLQLDDERIKRAVGVVRRTLVTQDRVRFVGDALLERRRKTGFANPRFT
jgi:hypothetical protein